MDAISVRGAEQDLTNVNCMYTRDGSHNGKSKYRSEEGNAIIYFDSSWKLHAEDDVTCWSYSNDATHIEPPVGRWLRVGDSSQHVDVEKPEVIMIVARQEFKICSGVYQKCGVHCGKAMYRNASGHATLSYNAQDRSWEVRILSLHDDDLDEVCYKMESTEDEPPSGEWPSCSTGPPCTVSTPEANISTQEAFFTVLVAVCVFKVNEDFRRDQDVEGWFLKFCIFYMALHGSMKYSARFGGDDLSHKLLWSLFQSGLLLMLVGLGGGNGGTARWSLYKIAATCTIALLGVGFSLRAGIRVPRARGYCLVSAVAHTAVACLIFSTCFANSRVSAVLWVAFFLSMGVDAIYVWLLNVFAVKPGSIWDVPMNIRYLIHRFDELQMEVLGVAIIVPNSIFPGDQAHPNLVVIGDLLAALHAILLKVGLFDVEPADISRHAVRRSKLSALAFMYLNSVTLLGLVGTGAGVPMLIKSAGAGGLEARDEFAQGVVCVASCGLWMSLTVTKLLHRPMSSRPWHIAKAIVQLGGGCLVLLPIEWRMGDLELLAFIVAANVVVVSPQLLNPTRYLQESKLAKHSKDAAWSSLPARRQDPVVASPDAAVRAKGSLHASWDMPLYGTISSVGGDGTSIDNF